jgi:hypothetical protein
MNPCTPISLGAWRRCRRWLLLFTAGSSLAMLTPATSALVANASRALEPSAEQMALLRRVRDNVALDDETLRKFSYTLERRTYDVNLVGKVSNGDIKTYEVVPSPFEPGRSWRRLVAVNGVKLSPERLRRDEEKARHDAAARARALASETPPARARRIQEEAREAQLERERLADIERVFQIEPSADEVLNGEGLAVFTMTPRPNAQTRSDVGRHLMRLEGRIWVDRGAAQLVKGEFQTTGDITVGWGMIGRVSGGSHMLYRRTREAGGNWLPVEMRFEGSGRTLMLIPFHLETWAKYGDFRPAAPMASREGLSNLPH